MDSREKAKAILTAIVEQAGGAFGGKTRLYKSFYIAHLLHFRDHAGILSDFPIVRMRRGPAVEERFFQAHYKKSKFSRRGPSGDAPSALWDVSRRVNGPVWFKPF